VISLPFGFSSHQHQFLVKNFICFTLSGGPENIFRRGWNLLSAILHIASTSVHHVAITSSSEAAGDHQRSKIRCSNFRIKFYLSSFGLSQLEKKCAFFYSHNAKNA
jgi:hypothetical protein